MLEDIKKLLSEGKEIEDIAETLAEEDNCMAQEFGEEFPNWCHEDADCGDCWRKKIEQIEKEM